MNSQLLATINTGRHITHEAGQVVHLKWDDHQLSLERSDFTRLVRTLERGSRRLYAGNKQCSVVQVDDDVREVWVHKTCLSLNRREYRALLNAAWTTETRLHGYRVEAQAQEEQPAEAVVMQPIPGRIIPSWN